MAAPSCSQSPAPVKSASASFLRESSLLQPISAARAAGWLRFFPASHPRFPGGSPARWRWPKPISTTPKDERRRLHERRADAGAGTEPQRCIDMLDRDVGLAFPQPENAANVPPTGVVGVEP